MIRVSRRNLQQLWPAGVALSLGIAVWLSSLVLLETSVLRPLPFNSPEQLIYLTETLATDPQPVDGVSEAALAVWAQRARSVTHVAGWEDRAETRQWLLTSGDDVEYIRGTTVTPQFFDVLGTPALLGRTFLAQTEYKTRFPPEVVISHELWRRRFGGRSDIVGQAIEFQRLSKPTVVGVMPPGFGFPDKTDVWGLTIPRQPPNWGTRTRRIYHGIARIPSDTRPSAVSAEFAGIVEQAEPRAATSTQWRVRAMPLQDWILGDHTLYATLLHAAGICVLLLAFANASHVMLAYELGSQRDKAIRVALGANARNLLISRLATVSIVVAAASLSAIALCAWLVQVIIGSSSAVTIPRITEMTLSWPVLAAAICIPQGLAVITAVVTARSVRVQNLTTILMSTSRVVSQGHSRLIRRILTSSQVAVAVVALSGSVVLIRAWYTAASRDPGFRTSQLAAIDVRLPVLAYGDAPWQRLVSFYSTLVAIARDDPAVSAAAMISDFPLSQSATSKDVARTDANAKPIQSLVHVVGGDYWAAMAIPVLEGRTFTMTEMFAPPDIARGHVSKEIGRAVISDVAKRALFGAETAVGKRLALEVMGAQREFEVIGVVGAVRVEDLRRSPRPELYLPLREAPGFSGSMVIRLTDDSAMPVIQGRLQRHEPKLMITRTTMADDLVARSIEDLTLASQALSIIGIGMILLTLVAVWSMCRIGIRDRQSELSVRKVLGAAQGRVFVAVLVEPLVTLSCGVILGAIFAFGLLALAPTMSSDATRATSTAAAAFLVLSSGLSIAFGHALRVMRAPVRMSE